MARAPDESPSELVNMTARARRLLNAVRDGRAVLSRDDEGNLCQLRLVLQAIAARGSRAVASLPDPVQP